MATKEYKLKADAVHEAIVEGELKHFEGGDMVPLTEQQFDLFKDKFVAPPAPAAPEPAQEKAADDKGDAKSDDKAPAKK